MYCAYGKPTTRTPPSKSNLWQWQVGTAVHCTGSLNYTIQLVLQTHPNNIACDNIALCNSAWRFFADRCQKVSALCKTYPNSNGSWSCHSMIVLLNHHRFLERKINSTVTHYTAVLRGKARRQDNSKFISGSFIRKTIIAVCTFTVLM